MASVKKSLDSDNESLMRMVKKKSDRNTGKKKEKTIERMLDEPVGCTRKKEARITEILRKGSEEDDSI